MSLAVPHHELGYIAAIRLCRLCEPGVPIGLES